MIATSRSLLKGFYFAEVDAGPCLASCTSPRTPTSRHPRSGQPPKTSMKRRRHGGLASSSRVGQTGPAHCAAEGARSGRARRLPSRHHRRRLWESRESRACFFKPNLARLDHVEETSLGHHQICVAI